MDAERAGHIRVKTDSKHNSGTRGSNSDLVRPGCPAAGFNIVSDDEQLRLEGKLDVCLKRMHHRRVSAKVHVEETIGSDRTVIERIGEFKDHDLSGSD